VSLLATAGAELGKFHAPHVDWKAMSPLVAVLGGSAIVLMAGIVPGRRRQRVVPAALAIVALLAARAVNIL
jgi:hypothetical protein